MNDASNQLLNRRQEEKARRRDEILDAAEAAYAEMGWDKLKMDDVAKRARLSRALVYVYFKDKDDLHFAIVVRAFEALRQAFQTAIQGADNGYDRFSAIGHAYVSFAKQSPHYFVAFSRYETHQPDHIDCQSNEMGCFKASHLVHRLMCEVIEQGRQDGSIALTHITADQLSILAWCFTHGFIQVAHTKRNLYGMYGISEDNLLEAGFALFGAALKSTAAPP